MEADLSTAYQQRGELRRDLDKAKDRGQSLELQLTEERRQKDQSTADKDRALSELEALKKQVADLQRKGEEQWSEKKELFLSSPEFQKLLGVVKQLI